MWFLAIYMFLCIGKTIEAPLCRPTITEGKTVQPEIDGFISVECEVSSCINPNKIVFEKAGLNAIWIPMFEAVNQTYHRALGTTADYTLKNRTDYYAFATFVHSLYIIPLLLKDHGEWRCVVYDITGKVYKSAPLNLNVYVPPTERNFYISPNNSFLVVDQTQEFTCVADGVHPEPEVLWKVNDVEEKGNATTRQRGDQLWVVLNTIRLTLDTLGVNKLNCIMRTQAKDSWMEHHINITVQNAAAVIYPRRGKTETVGVYSTFSLSCDGSGYNPSITWNRNGETILINDTRYIIQEVCDKTDCEGSISSKLMDPDLACKDTEYYSGVYTCGITVKPPYNSSAVSPYVNVTISKQQCKEDNSGPVLFFTVLSVVCVVLIVLVFVVLVSVKKRMRRNNEGPLGEPLLELEKELELITPKYATKNWVKLCGQSRSYDNIVLFEYGSKRVFIHDIVDLNKNTEHSCVVDIYAIIRISNDRFVVTEFVTHTIHLVKLNNGEFNKLDTMEHERGCSRTLICAENVNSFIKCEFSGDDLRHQVSIYRIGVTDHAFTLPQLLTQEPATLTGEPWRISLLKTKPELVIVTLSGKIFTCDLENNSTLTSDDKLAEHIVGGLRSLYIDTHDNVIIGDRGYQIHKYTPNKEHSMMKLDEPVRGLTVIDGRLIVCCGEEGKPQHIKVFSSQQLQK